MPKVKVKDSGKPAAPKKTKGKGTGKGKGKGKGKKGKGKKSKATAVPQKIYPATHPDVMTNAYYTTHTAPDFLTMRGFPWPSAPKKKGAKKGGKKKKK